MKFFVKAKFPPIETPQGNVTPEKKDRFHTQDAAFEFAGVCLEDGATSITIRPEGDRNA